MSHAPSRGIITFTTTTTTTPQVGLGETFIVDTNPRWRSLTAAVVQHSDAIDAAAVDSPFSHRLLLRIVLGMDYTAAAIWVAPQTRAVEVSLTLRSVSMFGY
ncbi:hypothetical protein AC579_6763 [Pseudocercospora musae]|uniref:Uncharacterized protein n=1 Tax=Pseudocercospora musae TaxID=113226 RepID=A0A139HFA1_9PEZI|nr:hypothetical protein AC579_6763 [Pseudocercospora musae]